MLRAGWVVLGAGILAAGAAEAETRKPYTRNVAIVVYKDVQPLDWTGPYEVYNDAGRFGRVNGQNAFNVYLVSKTSAPLDAQGLRIVPTWSIKDAPKPDIVVFPGGPAANVYDDPEFFAWAEKAAKEAEIAQSVCTGAFVLAKAGLLDGRDVTTFYGAIEGLRTQYPRANVQDGRRFVDNGSVVTTAGISAGIDGSLHVVARLLGRRIAEQVATYMEYRWSPDAYLTKGYSYLNPSTDDAGRRLQMAGVHFEGKDYAAAEATLRAALQEAPADTDAWGGLGSVLKARNDHLGAAEAFLKGLEGATESRLAYGLYRVAAEYALAGRKDQAFATLDRAFAAGYPHRTAVEKDPDFASLRDDARARALASAR
jgi:putative intracellular protease/amidase